jgi:hypothetical protein
VDQNQDQNQNERDKEIAEALRLLSAGINRVDSSQRLQAGELAALQGSVRGLTGEIGGLESRLVRVTGDLGTLRDDVSHIDARLTQQQEFLTEFQLEWRRNEIKRDAQLEHARLTAERDRRFVERARTRKLAHGLVNTATEENVRRGLVDTAHIKLCVQERFLHEPEFWLAPALLSAAADYCGQPDLSAEASGYASGLDESKTLLFHALIAARLGKDSGAGGYMDLYLQTLDPDRLTQDFLVVLEAAAGRELGAQAHTYAVRTMDRWYTEAPAAIDGEARRQDRLVRWRDRMWQLRTQLRQAEFATLRQVYAGNWQQLVEAYERATVAQGTLAYLTAQFPQTPEPGGPPARRVHVHSALEHLIDRLEPDEAELHAQIEWQQRLMDAKGDEAAAAREHEVRQSVDAEVVTFEELLDNAVFGPSQVELGAAARRLALACVWPQLQSMSTAFVQASLQQRPRSLSVVIDGWHADLPAEGTGEPELRVALTGHVEQETRQQVASVQPRWSRALGGAAGVVAGTVFAFLLSWVALLLGLMGALVCWYEYEWVPAERRRLESRGQVRQQHAVRQLEQALDERRVLYDTWSTYADGLTALQGWTPPVSRSSR